MKDNYVVYELKKILYYLGLLDSIPSDVSKLEFDSLDKNGLLDIHLIVHQSIWKCVFFCFCRFFGCIGVLVLIFGRTEDNAIVAGVFGFMIALCWQFYHMGRVRSLIYGEFVVKKVQTIYLLKLQECRQASVDLKSEIVTSDVNEEIWVLQNSLKEMSSKCESLHAQIGLLEGEKKKLRETLQKYIDSYRERGKRLENVIHNMQVLKATNQNLEKDKRKLQEQCEKLSVESSPKISLHVGALNNRASFLSQRESDLCRREVKSSQLLTQIGMRETAVARERFLLSAREAKLREREQNMGEREEHLFSFLESIGLNGKYSDLLTGKTVLSVSEMFSYSKKAKCDKTLDFMGCYIIHNETKPVMYYVGQGKSVPKRVVHHFKGKGNPDVYADYQAGDKFTIRFMDIKYTKYRRLDDMERDLIAKYDAYRVGYNRNSGNS